MDQGEMNWIALECAETKALREMFYRLSPPNKSVFLTGEVYNLIQDGREDEVYGLHGVYLAKNFALEMGAGFPEWVDRDVLSDVLTRSVGSDRMWCKESKRDLKSIVEFISKGRTWKKNQSHSICLGLPPSTTTTEGDQED